MPFLTVPNWQIRWTPLLVLGYLFYLLLGAMVFQLLEKQAETHSRDQFQLEKLKFLQNYTCLDRQALEQFVQVIKADRNTEQDARLHFESEDFHQGTCFRSTLKPRFYKWV